MNRQEIIDSWKTSMSYAGYDIAAAYEYVIGDDSKYAQIVKPRNLWACHYPNEIIAELDGENAETAMRCLRATAAMRRDDIIESYTQIGLIKMMGFTVQDILKGNFGFLCSYNSHLSYLTTAKEIIRCFPEETEKLITVDFLEKKSILSDEKAVDVAYCIASEFVRLNIDNSKKILGFGKSLADAVYDYAKQKLNKLSVCMLFGIYKTEPRFTELFKWAVSVGTNATMLHQIVESDCETKHIMNELDLGEEYIYYAVINNFSPEAMKTESEQLAQNETMLVKMIKSAASKKNSTVLTYMYAPLMLALNNGGGKKALEEFEKYYSILCCNLLGISLNEAEKFVKSVQTDSEKAAEKLHFTSNSLSYYSNNPIYIISNLSSFSKFAYTLVFTLLKSADMHFNEDGKSVLMYIARNFCLSRQDNGICSVYEALEFIISNGIHIKNLMISTAYAESQSYRYSFENFYTEGMAQLVKAHMSEAISVYEDMESDTKMCVFWAELLCRIAGCRDTEFLLRLLRSKSKVVSKIAAETIGENEAAIRPVLEDMIPKLKGDTAVRAKGIIKKWDNARKYGADFSFASNELAEEYVCENYDKSFDKKLAFIPEESFCGVRYADMNGTAPPSLIRYIFGEYMCLDAPYTISVCTKLVERLYDVDFFKCIENIYRTWIENGSDTKYKMLVVPYCIYASNVQILDMRKQLLAWADAARGALASFAVNALAVSGSSTALMMINDIAAKFPNNMVKKAAKSAFAYAAEALGVPMDVLADKIVPNLGLDKNGEAVLDYGSRTVTVTLMPDFSLSFYDNEKGKAVKSLPKPTANDDPAKAEQAKKYASELKKQLKAVISAQQIRLMNVFRNGRSWSVNDWNALFVENPVMHKFARTLIWGIYKNGTIQGSFRYSDDGTFCDMNDDEIELPENVRISLVHPIELTADELNAWLEQLGDYEIVQPFAQITANVMTLSDTDIGEKFRITKYDGKSFTVTALTNAAKKYDLARCSVEDAGGYAGFHLIDKVLGYGFAIHGDGMYVGQSYYEKVKLAEIFFYSLEESSGDVPDTYYEYKGTDPMKISKRFVSCCLNIIESIMSEEGASV